MRTLSPASHSESPILNQYRFEPFSFCLFLRFQSFETKLSHFQLNFATLSFTPPPNFRTQISRSPHLISVLFFFFFVCVLRIRDKLIWMVLLVFLLIFDFVLCGWGLSSSFIKLKLLRFQRNWFNKQVSDWECAQGERVGEKCEYC